MKILLYDIETAANLAYVWGKYEQNVIEYEYEWYMLSFAYMWLDEDRVHAFSLPDFKGYKPGSQDDSKLVKELWKLFDEADVIIAHNGDQFDIKKTNARFLKHGLLPPSPYKTIDTKKVAKKYFNFNSNKLDDIGNLLGIGRKMKNDGFELWKGCITGDMTSWAKMVKYNKQDIVLLKSVYLEMRPYMTNHPNYNAVDETEHNCPSCSSVNIIRRGFRMTVAGKKQAYQCKDCGAWSQGKGVIHTAEIRP